jgi:hypothetical protein
LLKPTASNGWSSTKTNKKFGLFCTSVLVSVWALTVKPAKKKADNNNFTKSFKFVCLKNKIADI